MLNIDDRLIKEVSPKIGPNALSVLLAIAIHLNQKSNRCFPSHHRLMELTGIGKNAVYDALNILKKEGILSVEQKIDSKKKQFGQRVFRLSTRFISIFVAVCDTDPLPESREPESREPESREPESREPESRETQQINESEQINEVEQIKKGEQLAPQAAFITTHTPTEFENIRIVEGQTFDLEEKTNLEPITPAAREHDSQILQDFANMGTDAEFEDVKRRMTAKPRTPKPAGNSTTSVCAEIKTPGVLDFFHAIHAAWAEWIDYKRRERKGTYKTAKTEAATIAALAKGVNYDPEAGRAAIEHSIAQTYAGIYPDKKFANDTNVARYSLEDRPQATTPTEMMKEAISFYQQNPKVWRDATLFGKVTEWTQEKHKDFLLKFCARQIADGRGRDTFGEINARLQAWFLNENKHQSPAQQQHTAGPQPQAPLRSAAPVNYSQQGPVLRSEQKAE